MFSELASLRGNHFPLAIVDSYSWIKNLNLSKVNTTLSLSEQGLKPCRQKLTGHFLSWKFTVLLIVLKDVLKHCCLFYDFRTRNMRCKKLSGPPDGARRTPEELSGFAQLVLWHSPQNHGCWSEWCQGSDVALHQDSVGPVGCQNGIAKVTTHPGLNRSCKKQLLYGGTVSLFRRETKQMEARKFATKL